MPARDFPNLGLKGGYEDHEGGWADDMNSNLLKLSALAQGTVLSKVNATPGSPVTGQVYLFSGTHPTQANKIAIYEGATGEEAWTYVTPQEGWLVYNQDENYYEKFDGAAWAELATGGGGGGGDLADLGDVDVVTTPPEDGQALVYDDATGKWKPGNVASGGGGGGAGNWAAAATWHWTGTDVVIDTATNVVSITRSDPGLYEIIFDTEAPDADYEVFAAGEFAAGATTDGIRGGSFNNGGGRGTTSCKVYIDKESVGAGGGFDAPRMSVMMFSMGALPFGGGGQDYKIQNAIDVPPVPASAWNEEFDEPDSLGLPAAWTWFNRTGSGQSYDAGIFNRKLHVRQTIPTGGWNFVGICKSPPAGDFDIVSKVTISGLARDYVSVAPTVFDSVSGKFITASFHARANGRFFISWNRWNNYNSLNTDNSFEVGTPTMYIRVVRVGTVISAMFSPDGEQWTRYTTDETEGVFLPSGWDQFGFFLKSENGSYPIKAVIHWVRDYQLNGLNDEDPWT